MGISGSGRCLTGRIANPPQAASLHYMALLLLLVFASACKHKVGPTLVEARSSFLKMGDENDGGQLVRGFYGIEGDGWRWASSKFAIALAKPQEKSSTVELKFSLPEIVVNQQGPVTLSAKINGTKLPSQTYSKPGEYTYSTPVPSSVLKSTNTVEFSTDKAIQPSAQDRRELALVVVSAGFTDASPH